MTFRPAPRLWITAALVTLVCPLWLGCSRMVESASSTEGAAPLVVQTEAGAQRAGSDDARVNPIAEGGSAPSGRDEPFEGTIVAEAELFEHDPRDAHEWAEASAQNFHFSVQGGRVRWNLFENVTDGPYRIYDPSRREFFTVFPREKTVSEALESDLESRALGVSERGREWEFSPSGGKAAVAGLACERWTTHDASWRYELCVTKEVNPLPLHLLPGATRTVLPFNDRLMALGYFPLSVIAIRSDPPAAVPAGPARLRRTGSLGRAAGVDPRLRGRFFVRAIERAKIDPEQFTPPQPPAYKRVAARSLGFETRAPK